jgi:hypothetical protein
MMKTIHIIFLLLLFYIQTTAQNAGTKTPYPAPAQKYTPPPPGFRPVFINHAGRHGARFLTKAGSDMEALQVLDLAAGSGALTEKGKCIRQMVKRFLAIEKGNYENITLLGRQEQAGIAARMLQHYPQAFGGRGLEVIMTHKLRTQQSATAFLSAFGHYAGKKNCRVVPDSLDNTLRFYDLSPAYIAFKESPAVRRSIDSLSHDPQTGAVSAAVCERLFNPAFAGRLFNGGVTVDVKQKKTPVSAVSFAENLYDLYSVQLSIPLEMQQKGFTADSIDFSIAFLPRELEWLAFRNGAEDFLEKGAGTDTLGIQVRVALPLLADFITSTEAVVNKTAAPDAKLRFTHAEAIAPFAALLGLPQASTPASSVYDYYRHWQAETVVPLSANIQWVLYSNGSDWLVKVLLNERETALPLPTATHPYYKWEQVKAYYLRKLHRLHADPQQDMQRYLLDLQ